MKITKNMLNGHQFCHGGMIFSLADTAFAYACNGYNQITVAQGCDINFIRSAHEGDILSAHAHEVIRHGRSGLYDVRVINQDKAVIAEFRGRSRTIRGSHFTDNNIDTPKGENK
jgi:acyl-CoA thioesterase